MEYTIIMFKDRSAPGAGLPPIENFILRHIFLPKIIKSMSLEQAVSETVRVGKNCLEMAKSLSEKDVIKPVVIPRIRGIEESSRGWSVAMTIEHLLIVHKDMLNIIQTLALGNVVTSTKGVADVKPTGQIPLEQLYADYTHALSTYESDIAALGDLNNKAHTHKHPWFWDMTAYEWLCVNAMHYKVHRKQIRHIMERL